MKKRILVFAPALPQSSDIEIIAQSLAFLQVNFQLDFIDPLAPIKEFSKNNFYRYWSEQLEKNLSSYPVFIGFSLGGVILLQNLKRFQEMKKTVVLFSTPGFVNDNLREKLTKVVELCKENQFIKAMTLLYKAVYYPNQAAGMDFTAYDPKLAAERLIFGLEQVLNTDSRQNLEHSNFNYLHLIGEKSNLVNLFNVCKGPENCLKVVPQAGMRVLEDNPVFCQRLILSYLGVSPC